MSVRLASSAAAANDRALTRDVVHCCSAGKRETVSQANVIKLVDKEYQKSSLKELAKGPLSIFKGLSESYVPPCAPLCPVRR